MDSFYMIEASNMKELTCTRLCLFLRHQEVAYNILYDIFFNILKPETIGLIDTFLKKNWIIPN